MKHWLPIVLLALLLLAPALGSAQQGNMPDLHLTDTENTAVSKKDIPKGKALLLVYFRSDCDHCMHTAMQLKTTAAKYPCHIWMVSGEDMAPITNFESMVGLYDFDNIRVLRDGGHQMHKYYDFVKLPFILLYSPSGKLLKTFEEMPDATTVRKILTGK